MKSYDEKALERLIDKAINQQNHFWYGCVIGLQYGVIFWKNVDKNEELQYCVDTEEQREDTFKPIVRVKFGSPYKDGEPKGHIVKWYDEENHNPVNVSYLRNKPEPVIYETGATKHHINSLVLFCDNTGDLINLRDEIYKNHLHETELKPEIFVSLCDAARYRFMKEVEYDTNVNSEYFKINKMQYKKYYSDVLEFCKIYVNRFNDWKFDHC
jgi:hypothetical protein